MEYSTRTAIDIDTMYRLAADERRRILIGILLDSDGPIPVDDLASRIVARQDDCYAHESTFVEVQLRSRYLPMLAEEEYVEFDREKAVVAPRQELAQFDEIIPDSYRSTLAVSR